MIEKIDLEESILTAPGRYDHNPLQIKSVLIDVTDKLNEVIDAVNQIEGVLSSYSNVCMSPMDIIKPKGK